ncbi:MAG: hypothetical protein U5L09_06395 [Bacteroidales bacterium]|nr:hypothetical protein [Bacteroidales bacterium]
MVIEITWEKSRKKAVLIVSAETLKQGGGVGYLTDTVYAFACSAEHPEKLPTTSSTAKR